MGSFLLFATSIGRKEVTRCKCMSIRITSYQLVSSFFVTVSVLTRFLSLIFAFLVMFATVEMSACRRH